MNKSLSAVAVLALGAVLAVAGCGSSSSNSSSSGGGGAYGSSGVTTKPASSSTGGTAAVVSVGSASGVGKVLVDSKGMTLYYFEKDKQGGSQSTCYGPCASLWPPQTTSGAPKVSGGAQQAKVSTIKRTDGTTQVTYAGWPLYTYAADTKPGDATGTDIKSFGGSWYPLHANGEKAGD